MKTSYYLFYGLVGLSIVYLNSCDRDDDFPDCEFTDPIMELTWLNESINQVQEDKFSYYVQAEYRNKPVFYYWNCNPAVNFASYLLDCEGNSLGYTNNFLDKLSNQEVIWKHPESECDLMD